MGYLAHGRSLAFSVDDSSETAFHTSLFDVWYATDSVAVPLPLAALPNYQHMELDSLAQAPLLFRTPTFEAHDSVQIGFSLSGMFGGVMDTANAAQVHLWLDLMNATTDTVVTVLDSAWITMSSPDHGLSGWPVLDLLSGSYYIRLWLDTVNIPAVVWNPNGSPKYPVVDLHGWMGDDAGGLSKLRREGNSTASQARIAAQPNPFTGTTELRFSIPSAGDVAIRVFDPIGRPVAVVLPGQWMDAGRYAVGFDASQLPPGTYMVELMLGQQRVVEKVVVAR